MVIIEAKIINSMFNGKIGQTFDGFDSIAFRAASIFFGKGKPRSVSLNMEAKNGAKILLY